MLKRPSTVLAALATLVALSALAGCSGDSSGTATDTAPTADATGPSCSYPSDGRPAAKTVDLPPDHASVSGDVPVTLETGTGTIRATLDADRTPCTVNSFASLADQGYFDGTTCHRLTTAGIYVLQCGDPTATGMGGPGYRFDDELTGTETYPAGTLAMANGGPDTNGSQFFLVYRDTTLDAHYTVFGTLDAPSLAVVQRIAARGTATGGPDGPPQRKVELTSVTAG